MYKRILFMAAVVLAISGLALAGNTATLIQTGPDNVGVINQTGDLNQATLAQHASIFHPRGHYGEIDQVGLSNWADVYQHEHNKHSADVDQLGNENRAQIVSLRNSETATIYQEGNLNDAYSRLHAVSATTLIEQIGNENIAQQDIGIGPMVKDSSFTAIQHGSSNQAYQNMYGTAWGPWPDVNNHGTIEQYGDGNYGFQEIGAGTLATSPDNNTATLVQTGNSNWSSQSQWGSGHSSTVTQTGDGNTSTVTQSN